jgi:hypothetical protein
MRGDSRELDEACCSLLPMRSPLSGRLHSAATLGRAIARGEALSGRGHSRFVTSAPSAQTAPELVPNEIVQFRLFPARRANSRRAPDTSLLRFPLGESTDATTARQLLSATSWLVLTQTATRWLAGRFGNASITSFGRRGIQSCLMADAGIALGNALQTTSSSSSKISVRQGLGCPLPFVVRLRATTMSA